eukprot:3189391-Rhodomonas_salina.1
MLSSKAQASSRPPASKVQPEATGNLRRSVVTGSVEGDRQTRTSDSLTLRDPSAERSTESQSNPATCTSSTPDSDDSRFNVSTNKAANTNAVRARLRRL